MLGMGKKKPTNAELLNEVSRLTNLLTESRSRLGDAQMAIQRLEDHNRRLVSDVNFWMEQSRTYANQLQQSWTVNADLVKQLGKSSGNIEFKQYADAVARAALELAPPVSEIAACIAMSGRDTQGIAAVGFDPNKRLPAPGGVIDVEG